MISKILVPSDGSKTAQKAAGYAVDLWCYPQGYKYPPTHCEGLIASAF